MPSQLPLQGEYYLLDNKVYRIVLSSKATDEIVLEDIEDKRRYTVLFSVFKWAYTRVWKVGDVAAMLHRSPRSIYRYEEKGLIQKANRYASAGDRAIRFYTKQDVLEVHEMISEIHQGRPRNDKRTVNNTIPGRHSLLQLFRERFGE